MVINFYRLYGTIFYEFGTNTDSLYYGFDTRAKDAVYFGNTSEDYNRKLENENYIPSETRLTDKEARAWFKEHFPDCEVHKINKHYHSTWRERGGDRMYD